jgi:hypothetical protein
MNKNRGPRDNKPNLRVIFPLDKIYMKPGEPMPALHSIVLVRNKIDNRVVTGRLLAIFDNRCSVLMNEWVDPSEDWIVYGKANP